MSAGRGGSAGRVAIGGRIGRELLALRTEHFERDPGAFWTAGQLRSELNLKLEDSIPDCAWVHRSAVRLTPDDATPATFANGKFTMRWLVHFDEPLCWHEMTWGPG